MFDAMTKIYEGPNRLSLPFGVLICRLLIEKGCQAYPYEESIRPKKTISATTLKLSQAHTRPRAPRREAAGASDDGSDSDDSDVHGESSILHRLNDVEAAVSDQSI